MSATVTFEWVNNPSHKNYYIYISDTKFDSSTLPSERIVVDTTTTSYTMSATYGSVFYAMMEIVEKDGTQTFSDLKTVGTFEDIIIGKNDTVHVLSTNYTTVPMTVAPVSGAYVRDVEVAPNGSIIVGSVDSVNDTVQYNAFDKSGNQLWASSIQAVGNYKCAKAIASNDKVYMSMGGSIFQANLDGTSETLLVGFDSIGVTNPQVYDFDISKSSTLYAVVRDYTGASTNTYIVVVNLADGTISEKIGVSGLSTDYPEITDIAVSESDNYIYFNSNIDPGSTDFGTRHNLNYIDRVNNNQIVGVGPTDMKITTPLKIINSDLYVLGYKVASGSTSVTGIYGIKIASDTAQTVVQNVPEVDYVGSDGTVTSRPDYPFDITGRGDGKLLIVGEINPLYVYDVDTNTLNTVYNDRSDAPVIGMQVYSLVGKLSMKFFPTY